MESTIFLASLWGPAILAVGLGVFVSKGFYTKIYRDLQREPFALLVFGMAGVAVGIAQISVHNVWNTPLEMLISLLGWGLLLKGATFLIKPDIADRSGDWVVSSKLMSIVGIAMLVIGIYLSYAAYIA